MPMTQLDADALMADIRDVFKRYLNGVSTPLPPAPPPTPQPPPTNVLQQDATYKERCSAFVAAGYPHHIWHNMASEPAFNAWFSGVDTSGQATGISPGANWIRAQWFAGSIDNWNRFLRKASTQPYGKPWPYPTLY